MTGTGGQTHIFFHLLKPSSLWTTRCALPVSGRRCAGEVQASMDRCTCRACDAGVSLDNRQMCPKSEWRRSAMREGRSVSPVVTEIIVSQDGSQAEALQSWSSTATKIAPGHHVKTDIWYRDILVLPKVQPLEQSGRVTGHGSNLSLAKIKG